MIAIVEDTPKLEAFVPFGKRSFSAHWSCTKQKMKNAMHNLLDLSKDPSGIKKPFSRE